MFEHVEPLRLEDTLWPHAFCRDTGRLAASNERWVPKILAGFAMILGFRLDGQTAYGYRVLSRRPYRGSPEVRVRAPQSCSRQDKDFTHSRT